MIRFLNFCQAQPAISNKNISCRYFIIPRDYLAGSIISSYSLPYFVLTYLPNSRHYWAFPVKKVCLVWSKKVNGYGGVYSVQRTVQCVMSVDMVQWSTVHTTADISSPQIHQPPTSKHREAHLSTYSSYLQCDGVPGDREAGQGNISISKKWQFLLIWKSRW